MMWNLEATSEFLCPAATLCTFVLIPIHKIPHSFGWRALLSNSIFISVLQDCLMLHPLFWPRTIFLLELALFQGTQMMHLHILGITLT
jgi:hypothetical protein